MNHEAHLAEFDRATARIGAPQIRYFQHHGISCDARHRVGHVGIERICTDGGSHYEPDPKGSPALVVGAWWPEPPGTAYPWVHPPELLDLIAFDLRGAWWQRTGAALVLGEHALAAPSRAVSVVASPLDYVRAAGRALLHLQPVVEAA
jgi:hypothetical protein